MITEFENLANKTTNDYQVMQLFYSLAMYGIMLHKSLYETFGYESCLNALKKNQKELNELNIDDSTYQMYFDSLQKYLNNAIEEIENNKK